jgi:hypothetical protein
MRTQWSDCGVTTCRYGSVAENFRRCDGRWASVLRPAMGGRGSEVTAVSTGTVAPDAATSAATAALSLAVTKLRLETHEKRRVTDHPPLLL